MGDSGTYRMVMKTAKGEAVTTVPVNVNGKYK
mgnify:FL=1